MKREKHEIYEWFHFAGEMLCVLLFLYIVKSLFFSWAVIDGDSMMPSIQNRDIVIVVKTMQTYKRGDIVICHSGKGYERNLIKRVIGVPGDVIEIDTINHRVLVNQVVLDEPYLLEETWEYGDVHYPVKVPPGQYFVMGDNRNNSLDSRYSEIGTLPSKNIEGKVKIRVYPFSRIFWFG